MMAISDPSQISAFSESSRPAKRRGVPEEPIELDEDAYEVAQNGLDGGDEKPGVKIPESACEFSSVLDLRRAVKKRGNAGE